MTSAQAGCLEGESQSESGAGSSFNRVVWVVARTGGSI